jgi:hypothetical protein
MTDKTLDLVRSLDPTSGADPADAVANATREELLTQILQIPALPARLEPELAGVDKPGRRRLVSSPPSTPWRRRFLVRRVVPVLVAAGLIAAIVVSVVGLPGGTRQEAIGPALSFTPHGDDLVVRILDPLADSARYNKEFKDHHLDIKLILLPTTPSLVGKNIGEGYEGPNPTRQITFSPDPPGCDLAGTYPCVPQFTIPRDYEGTAQLYIGRAPRPGEHLAASGLPDGPGEPLAGVKWQNMRVGAVLAILTQRGYTVSEYRIAQDFSSRTSVPANWYAVEGGFLLKDKQVVLMVSNTPQ